MSDLGLAPELVRSDGSQIEACWHEPLTSWRAHHTDVEWQEIGLNVLQLVKELHGHGICHRDLHVGNIVVRDGMPLLIDMEFAIDSNPVGPCYDLVGQDGSLIAVPARHAVQPNANQYGVWWDADNSEVETLGHAFGRVEELARALEARSRLGGA